MTYHDVAAELAVAGCAVHTPEGSRLAHLRVTADDFYDPALARIFTITPQLPCTWPDYQADPWAPLLDDLRIAAAAELAGINERQIRLLLQHRPVMCDTTGVYAARVLEAANLRRLRHDLVEALELVDGADLTRAAELLDTCRSLALEAA